MPPELAQRAADALLRLTRSWVRRRSTRRMTTTTNVAPCRRRHSSAATRPHSHARRSHSIRATLACPTSRGAAASCHLPSSASPPSLMPALLSRQQQQPPTNISSRRHASSWTAAFTDFSVWGGSGWLLKTIHMEGMVPYWACFAVVNLLVRFLLLPLVLQGARTSSRFAKVIPEVQFLLSLFTNDMRKLRQQKASLVERFALMRMNWLSLSGIYKLHKIHPMAVFWSPLLQLPIFWYVSVDLRKIVNGMDPLLAQALVESPVAWIPDLTEPDPWFGLPVLAGLLLYANVEVAVGRRSLAGPQTAKADTGVLLKDIFQSFAVFMPCFTSQMPAGLQIYVCTSFLFTMGQSAALRDATLRSLVGLPPLPVAARDGSTPMEAPKYAQQFIRLKQLEAKAREIRGNGPVLGRGVLAKNFECSFPGTYRPSTIEIDDTSLSSSRPSFLVKADSSMGDNRAQTLSKAKFDISASPFAQLPYIHGVSAPPWQLAEQAHLFAKSKDDKNDDSPSSAQMDAAMTTFSMNQGEGDDDDIMERANRGLPPIPPVRLVEPANPSSSSPRMPVRMNRKKTRKGGKRKRWFGSSTSTTTTTMTLLGTLFLTLCCATVSGMQTSWVPPESPHVRFVAPLVEYGFPPAVSDYASGAYREKPLLLYLPGFDGTFLSPFLQFPELGTTFDVRCMTVGVEDRSTIDVLKQSVLAFVRAEANTDGAFNVTAADNVSDTGKRTSKRSPRRPFYLAGESFGGILACEVAMDILRDKSLAFQGLALINPATCYYRSRLALEGPLVAESNPWFYYFRLLGLLPLFTDDYSIDQLLMILLGEALPSVIDNEVREAYLGRVAFSLPFVVPIMKQGTLQWRLSEWLEKGSARMEEQLEQLALEIKPSFRVLLVVGENDRTLPSINEAERLAGLFRPSQLNIHVVEGAGHASTCGSRVDLAALFRQTYPRLRRRRNASSKTKIISSSSIPWWQPWRRAHNDKGNEEDRLSAQTNESPRTSMKAVAAQGQGKYLGMEPRYDNATIGLSPLRYWNSAYYRPLSKEMRRMQRVVDTES